MTVFSVSKVRVYALSILTEGSYTHESGLGLNYLLCSRFVNFVINCFLGYILLQSVMHCMQCTLLSFFHLIFNDSANSLLSLASEIQLSVQLCIPTWDWVTILL